MMKSFLKKLFPQSQDTIDEQTTEDESIAAKEQAISGRLQTNVERVETLYHVNKNIDLVIRHFTIGGTKKNAALIFYSSTTDQTVIEMQILRPLLSNRDKQTSIKNILTAQSIIPCHKMSDLLREIGNGNTALLIDGEVKAYAINTTKFQGRSVEKPENEVVLRGPNEAFNENIEASMSLIRKKIKNENLIFEAVPVSKRSHNVAYITYLHDLTNEDLIARIKKQLSELDVDAVPNTSVLEHYIEERPKSLFPSILYTERPDRVTDFIENGHLVLIMDNSPAALILPATFWSFYHSSEDNYNRFLNTNFTRILRLIALFISLFIASFYVAVTTFHSEMIPFELLMAIVATREKVPFPPLIEVFLMQIAFELIREAGLRVPMPIGSTIGIVGALILGQAAVEANIVSPIVVIIVALDGLSSFALSDMSLNFAIRMLRFIAILSAALFGFLGIVFFFIILLFYLVSITSFGVPYFAPKTPHYPSSQNTYLRDLFKHEIFRPGYVKPKDITKKPRDVHEQSKT